MAGGPRVGIIGAGAVGASIACHLAKLGAAVVLFDENFPGSGTSTASFAYLSVLRQLRPDLLHFRLAALKYWQQLAAELGAEGYLHCDGSIFVAGDDASARALETYATAAEQAGLKCERIDFNKAVDHEPDLVAGASDIAVFRFPEEGWLEAAPMIGALLGRAREAGARVYPRTAISGIDPAGAKVDVRLANGDVLTFDRVVIAAGPGSGPLLQSMGVSLPIELRPGVTAFTRPTTMQLRHIVYVPGVHFRPDSGGRIILGQTDYDHERPSDEGARARAQQMIGLARPWLRSADELSLEALRIGVRCVPGDSLPIIGPLPSRPNIYVAVMHSGISLSGWAGALAASEIITGRNEPVLEIFRPSRFDGAPLQSPELRAWAPSPVA